MQFCKVNYRSRFGRTNLPFKRVFISRIKSVVNYLPTPRCSYHLLYWPYFIKSTQVCFDTLYKDSSWVSAVVEWRHDKARRRSPPSIQNLKVILIKKNWTILSINTKEALMVNLWDGFKFSWIVCGFKKP